MVERMTHPAILAAMARRRKLTFAIPGRADPFTCYPLSDEQAARWRDKASAAGWQLIGDREAPRGGIVDVEV